MRFERDVYSSGGTDVNLACNANTEQEVLESKITFAQSRIGGGVLHNVTYPTHQVCSTLLSVETIQSVKINLNVDHVAVEDKCWQ